MPRKLKSTDSNAQNRESQRRSRARRRELIDDLSRELAKYKSQGVAASVAMQTAARAVSIENQRLRALLGLYGVSQGKINLYLASLQDDTITNAASARDIANADPIRRSDKGQTSGDSPFARTQSKRANDTPDTPPRCQSPLSSNVTHSVLIDATTSAITSETGPPRLMHPTAGLSLEATHSRPQYGSEERCRWPAQDHRRSPEQPAYSKYGMADDIFSPVCDSFSPPVRSTAENSGKDGLETSCDTAAAILIELHGKADPVQARAALGCVGSTSCSVKNTTIFRLMDELG